MSEQTAKVLAAYLGGEASPAGGIVWLVLVGKGRPDDTLVVLGDDGFEVTTQADFDAMRLGRFYPYHR
jgi:hypothetical protein